jgi:hypothetical protein
MTVPAEGTAPRDVEIEVDSRFDFRKLSVVKSSPDTTLKKPLQTSSLLGVALAGITCFAQQAGAATTFTEVTDFGNSMLAATDLSAEFIDFGVAGGIIGQMSLNNSVSDYADYFVVNAAALSLVNIPTTCMSSAGSGYFGFNVFTTTGSYIGGSNFYPEIAGSTYSSNLSFTVPANGKVIIGTSQESGNTTFNYTLGVVPEPSTGLLSLAAIAAAALRRRREVL